MIIFPQKLNYCLLQIFAWKEMDYGSMTESEKQMLVSEVNLLRELKHKHIVRYYDRIIDRSNMTIYIIMEYCDGGDLATLIMKNRKEGYGKIRIISVHVISPCKINFLVLRLSLISEGSIAISIK